jgi:hypothetical protein
MLSLSVDPHGSVYLPSSPTSRFQYKVDSRLTPVPTKELQAETLTYPSWVREGYLQHLTEDPRIIDLARAVTKNTRTVYEQIKAIETHLKTRYEYSLDVPAIPGRSPIDDFLFGQKTGYCEHFATAMLLLLRSLDIPSRLVTGFLQGEWNEYGGYYIVRQRDAHAWVEAYFPQSGWITFDPTPPTLPKVGGWATTLSHYLDHLRIRWERYIINYSSLDQIMAVSKVKDQTDSAVDALQQGMSQFLKMIWSPIQATMRIVSGSPSNTRTLFLIVAGAILFLIFLIKNRPSRVLRLYRTIHGGDPSSRFYLLMLQILASKGLVKKQHLTSTEFLKGLLLCDQDLEKVSEITQTYYRARFGRKDLSFNERRRIETLLESLIEAKPRTAQSERGGTGGPS